MDATVIRDLGDFWARWDFISAWTFILALFALVYTIGTISLGVRSKWRSVQLGRVLAAVGFFCLLFVALVGPAEALAGELLLAHMLQHMLIIFAAPLILIANPLASYMWGTPPAIRAGLAEVTRENGIITRALRQLTRPKVSLPLFVLTLWIWHFPPLYNLALANGIVHVLEHLTMFLTALIFWWPLVGSAPNRAPLSYPRRIAYLILVLTPSAALGAIITLSRNVLYDFYEDAPMHFELTNLQDQQIAGLILWVLGNSAYLAALITVFLKWAREQRKLDWG